MASEGTQGSTSSPLNSTNSHPHTPSTAGDGSSPPSNSAPRSEAVGTPGALAPGMEGTASTILEEPWRSIRARREQARSAQASAAAHAGAAPRGWSEAALLSQRSAEPEARARLLRNLVLERLGLGLCAYTSFSGAEPCLLNEEVLEGRRLACGECRPHLGKVRVEGGSQPLMEGKLQPLTPPPLEAEYARGVVELLLRASVRLERVAAGYALVRHELQLAKEELNRAREGLGGGELRGNVYQLGANLTVRSTEAFARYEAFQMWASEVEEWATKVPAEGGAVQAGAVEGGVP